MARLHFVSSVYLTLLTVKPACAWINAVERHRVRTSANETLPTRYIGKTSNLYNEHNEKRAESFQHHESGS